MSDQRIDAGDIMRADPRRKRQAWLLIALLILAGAALKLLALPVLLRWLAVSDNAVLVHRVGVVFYAMSATMVAIAALVGWHASRILRSNQSPPPNTWVLRDTPIVRGAAAHLRGWIVMACAVAFVVLAIYAALLPAHMQKLAEMSRSTPVPLRQVAPRAAPGLPVRSAPVVPHPHHAAPTAPQTPPIAKPHG
jgi:hypothetical protein